VKKFILLLTLVTGVTSVLAAQKMVTLAVAGMSCAACPITVKKALTQVNGVSRVDVDFDKRQVLVSFDDAKTNLQQLTQATVQAGFPSTLKESKP
jgi:mercuric ion binding protein